MSVHKTANTTSTRFRRSTFTIAAAASSVPLSVPTSRRSSVTSRKRKPAADDHVLLLLVEDRGVLELLGYLLFG